MVVDDGVEGGVLSSRRQKVKHGYRLIGVVDVCSESAQRLQEERVEC